MRLLKSAILAGLILLGAGEVRGATLTLTWIDNSNAETGQEIWSCLGTGCTAFAIQTTVAANLQSFLDSNLAELVTKCYEVRAVSSTTPAANSNFSNQACGTTRLNAVSSLVVGN